MPGAGARSPRHPLTPSPPQSGLCYYALGYADFHQRAIERAHGWMGDLAPYLEQKEALAPDSGVLYGLSSLNVFGGLDTRRAKAVYTLLADDRQVAGRGAHVAVTFAPSLALLGVTHVVTPYALPLPGLREMGAVSTGDTRHPVRVYAVEGARPRVWIPEAARPAANWQESLAGLKAAAATVIEGAAAGTRSGGGEVLSVESGPGFARARVRMRGAGFVVHNQRHYPGWSAAVDGRPAPLYYANCLMQAAPVPAGEHTVEFRFDSPSYVVGRAITLMALALLAAAGLLRRARRPSRAATPASD